MTDWAIEIIHKIADHRQDDPDEFLANLLVVKRTVESAMNLHTGYDEKKSLRLANDILAEYRKALAEVS